MRYGIYDGSIVTIDEIGNMYIVFLDEEPIMVPQSELRIISEDLIKLLEPEISKAKTEVKSILTRLNNLDKAYQEKREALRCLLTEARRNEIKIISRMLKEGKNT